MTPDEFKRIVRNRWPVPYALTEQVLAVIEPAVSVKRKVHRNEFRLSLDMLFLQAYKALASVQLLADYGHMEDGATIARRLLELAALAGYIARPDSRDVRLERSREFLSTLWRELPPAARKQLPPDALNYWQQVSTPPDGRAGLPSIQAMFVELGRKDTYDDDYRFLAAIAHGGSPDQLIAYSRYTVRVRSLDHLGSILGFGARYALATTVVWNDEYALISPDVLQPTVKRVASWPERKGGANNAA